LPNRTTSFFGLAAIALAGFFLATAAPCHAQNPGRSGINDRNGFDRPAPKPKKPSTPPPRAISVLEWTPDVPAAPAVKLTVQPAGTSPQTPAPKPLPAATSLVPAGTDIPKSARLIPVSIYYQGAYQDAGVFLSQPTPLALQADTVYDLEKAGDPDGTFTLRSASHQQDMWLGFGVYAPKPPPKPFKPNVPNVKIAKVEDEEEGDRPVLKRRSTSDSGSASSSGQSGDTRNPTQAPPDSNDPDRPILKRPASTAPASSAPTGADDPDRPKLERKPASGSASEPRTSDDYLNPADDPNRPRIRRGAFREKITTLPELLGSPENIRQTVAVSDAARSEEHPFAHVWNDNAERDRARDAMQKLALQQLAAWQKANPTPAAAKTSAAHATATHSATAHSTAAHPHKAVTPSPELSAVQFAAYDLAYQDEPTYVFAAQTTAAGLDQKFLAVVARPDIYGNLQVVYSAITDGSHLGLTPRYRLVDAVDADGDGRAELLLEARNLDGRRFVLLDVYRGAANKVFETGLLP
jgi:hypothetical protein